jgi:murein peptide amidase A
LIATLAATLVAAIGAPGVREYETGPTARPGPLQTLKRTVSPRRPVLRHAAVTLGRSARGRPITAIARNGVRTSATTRPGGPLVLVFGCVHGDECAAIDAVKRAIDAGCPPPGDGLVVVPNLNPDGYALGTRLNARGVDLNRNFSVDWAPGGAPGDLEYPGPGPFSEPETRIARRLIRALRPDVTIWFHQQAEPLVRAWGPSIPAARAYARLAGLPFVALPWIDGTAPNWQNHRFGGTSSFVVELPSGGTIDNRRQADAIFRLAIALMHADDD